MAIEKIERIHSILELILALTNNWCEKHNEKPEFCGATEEARKVAGNVLKFGGSLFLIAALVKLVSK